MYRVEDTMRRIAANGAYLMQLFTNQRVFIGLDKMDNVQIETD